MLTKKGHAATVVAHNMDSTPPRPKTSASLSFLVSPSYYDLIIRQPPTPSASTCPDPSSTVRPQSSTNSQKRLSMFRSRSRSNTNASSASSSQSPDLPMTSLDSSSSRRSSQDGRTLSSFFLPAEKDGLGKSLMSRGSRMLKRQGSKSSLTSYSAFEPEDEMSREKYRRGRNKRIVKEKERVESPGIFHRIHKSRHNDMRMFSSDPSEKFFRPQANLQTIDEFLKRTISEPFDFQHVTHTNQSQLPPVEYTHPHDLAAELSIIRASQRPGAELKGIRAESIFDRNVSSEDITGTNLSTLAPDSQSLYTRSPPRSPTRIERPKLPNDKGAKRASRSVENFSRPVSRASKLTSTPSITPPPRISSKYACSKPIDPTSQTIDALLGVEPTSATFDDSRSPLKENTMTLPQLLQFESPEPPEDVIHAVTCDDHSPAIPRTSSFDHISGLANIPEENELAWRNSHISMSPIVKTSQFLHPVKSDLDYRPDNIHSPIIPALEEKCKEPNPQSDRLREQNISVKVQHVLEDSWEDDIDYCYEHAAESNSNFDWQRVSVENLEEGLASLVIGQDGSMNANYGSLQTFKSSEEIPYGGPASTIQGNTCFALPNNACADQNISDSFFSNGQKSRKYKPDPFQDFGPSFDDRLSPLQMYGGMMPNIQESDEEVVYAQLDDQFVSAGRSCSPLSKCNSQESMILARAASSARKHRSSTSTNSVPDLIHSPSISREAIGRDNASPMADQGKPFVPRSPVATAQSHGTYFPRGAYTTAPSPSEAQTADKQFVPFHDRAKSESTIDSVGSGMSTKSQSSVPGRKRSSTLTRGAANRKTRTSYSLFPTAPSSSPTTPPTPNANSK
ncbi:hypothetical protein LOZ66_000507 [Ophidiomyces ophidiicola]|nr:hypothetical protein LOZ66_000507 [Ophidiomyces ophidiicola]